MRGKLLTKFVDAYRKRHDGNAPTRIVVAPVALLSLGIKESVNRVWMGIPVECRLFELDEVVRSGSKLGVFTRKYGDDLELAACELD